MIEVKCSGCGTSLRAKDDLVGQKIQCPKCKADIQIPGGAKKGELPPVEAHSEPAMQVKQQQQQAQNMNLMIAVVGSGIGVIVVLLIVLILIFSFRGNGNGPTAGQNTGASTADAEDEDTTGTKACAGKLKAIFKAIEDYRANQNKVPDSFATLVDNKYLPDREAFLCNGIPFDYRPDGFRFGNLGIDDSELIIVVDDGPTHDGKRNALFRNGSTALITEKEYREAVRELTTAVAVARKREDAEKEKAVLEKEAAKVYESYRSAGPTQIEAALEHLKTLRTAYAETSVYKDHREEIEADLLKLKFSVRLSAVHRLIEDAKYGEAKAKYNELKQEFSARAEEIKDEAATLQVYENALKLRREGKLNDAKTRLLEIMKKRSPSWKRHANIAIQEIDSYVRRAAKLFSTASAAEKGGREAFALMTYYKLCREYPAALQCRAAADARDKLIATIAYGPRFLDKTNFYDENERKKNFHAGVDKGLEWLKGCQSENGSWDADAFGGNETPDPGDAGLDIAVTGAALLTFLGEGSTLTVGNYENVVAKGVKFLKGSMNKDGVFGDPKSPNASLNQVMAIFALAEAANMTGDEEIIAAVKKAVRYIMKIQKKGLGWADGPLDENLAKAPSSTLLTGWMTLALASARNLGIDVHGGVFGGARNWFYGCTDHETGLVGAFPTDKAKPEEPSPERVPIETAAATLGRYYIAGTGAEIESSLVDKSLEILFKNPPMWDHPAARKVNFTYWYFGLHALAQERVPQYGQWRWNLGLELSKNQIKEGPHAGSWPDPVRQRNFIGGRIWSTALAVLILQNPYNRPGGKLHPRVKKAEGKTVTLVLDDGTYISGEMIERTEKSVTIKITRGRSHATQSYPIERIKKILDGDVKRPEK
ncbi:MAG: hypothetical protein E3J72_05110 [Planctomycetota bacterium]|nr:MAG: hypothetical protein E3J72_05110 [Planctomycetota bacterium]